MCGSFINRSMAMIGLSPNRSGEDNRRSVARANQDFANRNPNSAVIGNYTPQPGMAAVAGAGPTWIDTMRKKKSLLGG